MELFLTGASGFVGGEVLRQLTEKGLRVRCLTRAGAEKKLPRDEAVRAVAGDVTEPAGLSSAMEGCRAVIHLVGIIRAVPARGLTFEKIHCDGTRHIVDAAKEAGVKRILHMSALGTKADASSAYHRTKYLAERYVQESGLDYTIFRPSVIFGPGDAFVNMLAKMIRFSFLVPVIGDGKYKLQPVAVEDVARGFVNALDTPAASGRIYEAVGSRPLEYNELLDIIAERLGRKIFKIHQPVPLVQPFVKLFEGLSFFPLTSDQLLMLQEDNVGDNEAFCRDLGVEPVSFREGIKKWL